MVAIGASKIRSRILVVDDDTTVVRLLGQALQGEGYETIFAQDGAGAVEAISDQHPALIILDINLPKVNGFEVCRKVREASRVPIVFISGRGSDEDKMYAFRVGADDYVTKPFNVGELMARVRAVLRRSVPMTDDRSDGVFRYTDLEIDFPTRHIRYRGREVSTTPIEFDLLRTLVLNAGKVLTHQRLLNEVWGPEYSDEREYLRVHLSHLRHKIEPDPNHPQYIQTVPRIGYRFVPL
ncbi:response regulator transcription factor [Chloroflexota bacterium]